MRVSVGARIRALRNDKHLTLAEVATQIGMTPAGLSLIELEKRRVTAQQMELLARALGVRPGDFFGPDLDATSSKVKEAPANE